MSLNNEQAFAIKIHHNICGYSKEESEKKASCKCGFISHPKSSKDWFRNHRNKMFLMMSRKSLEIIEKEGISEEDMLKYLRAFNLHRYSEIPRDILDLLLSRSYT